MINTMLTVPADRSVTRVRHDLKRRPATVLGVAYPTPNRVRLKVGGPAFLDFTSPGFDDHVKVILPVGAEGDAVVMRDYTPHDFDPRACSLELDFALHDGGPVTDWARQASEGDPLVIGGPRGSRLVGTGFEWHLLMGDETALPAIARRLAELPPAARATVIVETRDPNDEPLLASSAALEVRWLRRGERTLSEEASTLSFGTETHYAWAACEATEAKQLRTELVWQGADPAAMRVAGYWKRGTAAVHDVIEGP